MTAKSRDLLPTWAAVGAVVAAAWLSRRGSTTASIMLLNGALIVAAITIDRPPSAGRRVTLTVALLAAWVAGAALTWQALEPAPGNYALPLGALTAMTMVVGLSTTLRLFGRMTDLQGFDKLADKMAGRKAEHRAKIDARAVRDAFGRLMAGTPRRGDERHVRRGFGDVLAPQLGLPDGANLLRWQRGDRERTIVIGVGAPVGKPAMVAIQTAIALSVSDSRVRCGPDPRRADHYLITVSTGDDVLSAPLPGLPELPLSITEGVIVGRDADASEVRWVPSDDRPHVLVTAQSGSGKTVMLRTIVAQIGNCADAEVWLGDPEGDLDNVHHLCTRVARTKAEVVAMVAAARAAMNTRPATPEACRRAGLPLLVVVIDEVQMLTGASGNDSQRADLIDLAQRGRKRNIQLILATQRPLDRNVPTDILSQLRGRLVGALETPEEVRRAIGDTAERQGLSTLGWSSGLWQTRLGTAREWVRVRGWHPSDADLRAIPPVRTDPGEPAESWPQDEPEDTDTVAAGPETAPEPAGEGGDGAWAAPDGAPISRTPALILAELARRRSATSTELATATGYSERSVSRNLTGHPQAINDGARWVWLPPVRQEVEG